MNEKEYDEKMAAIKEEHTLKKHAICKEFSFSRNTVKIGDVIEDHIGKIKVEKIKVHVGYTGYPECVYFGAELTKKGVPFKNGSTRNVFQSNLRVK